MKPIELRSKAADVLAMSASFDELSPSGGSLASMNAAWIPNRKLTIGCLAATSMLLIWGTAFNGRSFGPVRLVLVTLPYGDKVGHVVLYGVITLAISLLVRTRSQAIVAALMVITAGIGDEFRQLTEPRRNFSITDVLANLGGVSAGLLAAFIIARIARSRHV